MRNYKSFKKIHGAFAALVFCVEIVSGVSLQWESICVWTNAFRGLVSFVDNHLSVNVKI